MNAQQSLTVAAKNGLFVLCLVVSATALGMDLDPVCRGTWTGDRVHAVVVRGDYAYLAIGSAIGTNGLAILDIRNKKEPRSVGFCPIRDIVMTFCNATGLALDGNFAYIPGRTNGLHVIDVTDPANPRRVGGCDTGGAINGVALSGKYAYVVGLEMETNSFRVIDVSNPTSPQLVANCATSYTQDLAIDGHYAYLADPVEGLRVVDISHPTAPEIVATCALQEIVQGVIISGHYAYVNGVDGLLGIVDISNPLNPQLIQYYRFLCGATLGMNLAIAGNYLFISLAFSSPGLEVVDISDPANPQRRGVYMDYISSWLGEPRGLAVSGNYVYEGGYPFQVIEWTNPANPQRVGRYDTAGLALAVATVGNYAYVADGPNGLEVLDISNPASPQHVGNAPSGDVSCDVAIAGNYAYVADRTNGLVSINISNPAAPQRTGKVNSSRAVAVKILGNYVYVADWNLGMQIIDISNAANPRLVGVYPTMGYAPTLAVAGHYAYVADWNIGLQVVDIANPAKPLKIGTYVNERRQLYGVAISGNYAYLNESNGPYDNKSFLRVLDISNPAKPACVGSYTNIGSGAGLLVLSNYVYQGDPWTGLRVIDVSDPSNPRRVGENRTFRTVGITLHRDKILAAVDLDGLAIFNPFNPFSGPSVSLSAPTYLNSFSLSIQGLPGLSVELERSSDLNVWQPWTSVILESTPIELPDLDPTAVPCQFYRAIGR